MMIARILIATLLFAVACLSLEAGEFHWNLRIYGAMVDSLDDSTTSPTGVASSIDVGGGLVIGGELRMSDRLGLELSSLFGGLDIETSVATGAGSTTESLNLEMVPLTLGLTVHLTRESRVDVFLAPTLGFVDYYRLTTNYTLTGMTTTEDSGLDMALGAAFGLDIPVGSRKWAVATGVRYMKTGSKDTDVDVVMATLGFSRRF